MGAVWLPAAAALLVGSTWASCEEEFKAKQQEFTTYGAFPFKIARGEWIPQAIQEYFLMEGDENVVQLKKLSNWVHHMLVACWSIGGRMWEVRLQWNTTVWHRDSLEDLTEIHNTVCALASCQTRHVLRSIAPMISFSNPQVYERFSGVAKVLSSWKFMKIDFAIIGTGGCGTTSLRRNLAQHAEVRFTNENEDELFAPGYAYEYQGGFRLLPTEAQVNMVRCGRARCHGERKERVVLGVKNFQLHNFDFGLVALSMLDRVKLIMLVCDPLDRLEKVLHYFHCGFDAQTRQHCQNRTVIDEIVAKWSSVAHLVEEHKEHWVAARRLLIVSSLFDTRDVMVVHQQILREFPARLYRALFHHIGLQEPPDIRKVPRDDGEGRP
ncbi:unnamed protein product [Durusdinium trenchii]|uniref:Sulfotransferase n=1 Tax=Durusdinium trenchii TaxID=1381693 RepID=A0ABP0PSP3_9DINO